MQDDFLESPAGQDVLTASLASPAATEAAAVPREAALWPAAASAPTVSVIIPHYNSLADLARCLAHLARQSIPADDFEVIVADNNSRCGIEAVRRVCGDFARVVHAPAPGAGPTRNAAVEVSRGRILAFTDHDCRPEPRWLELGIAALSDCDIVGGRVDVLSDVPHRPTAVESFERVFAFNVERYVEQEDFAVTANILVTRDVFDRVGGFRRELPEDKDWGQRAVAAGFRWSYRADVVVGHPARRDWSELTHKWSRTIEADFLQMLRKPFGRARWLLRSVAVLASPFVHWMKVVRSPKLETVDQRLGAIRVLFRIRFWRFGQAVRLLAGAHAEWRSSRRAPTGRSTPR